MSMHLMPQLIISILLALSPSDASTIDVGGASIASDSYEDVVKSYSTYLKQADLDDLANLYDENVIVRSRSRLLEKDLKGKGVPFGEDGDRVVSKEELIKAYKKLIDDYGVDAWKQDGEEATKEDTIDYYLPGDELYDEIAKKYQSQKGDVFVVIAPKRNPIFLQLRIINKRWRIISEEWS